MKDDRHVTEWIDLVADLLTCPQPEFPRAQVATQLERSFEVVAVSWDWRTSLADSGFEAWPAMDFASVAGTEGWHEEHTLNEHPLIRWFMTTQDSTAQTTGRVPQTISTQRGRDLVRILLRPFGCDEQLSMPYVLHGSSYATFVLGRTGDDFDEQDLELAGHLQPLIRALSLRVPQVCATPASDSACAAATTAGLTGTELSVLTVLAEGHTAVALARRLAMSPRTAQKHLEHIYRKLGVNDRLSAVLAAQEAHILPPSQNGVSRTGDDNRVESPTGSEVDLPSGSNGGPATRRLPAQRRPPDAPP